MRNKRLWAFALATTLTMTSLTGCGGNKISNTISKETKESVAEMEQMSKALDDAGLVTHSDTSGKEETVYVIMDANGAKNETIVSEWLKNPEAASEMVDITGLSDIEVVKGDATYTQDADGQMHWNTEGGDVYYQGRTDKDLPVDVKVSYELDGKPVNAEALKDVTGHVKIKYDYDNKISKVMEIGGEQVSIYQPFTMITGLLFDDEKTSNIKVSDGKVINSGSYTAVFGVAMPGLAESIGLDKINEEKDTGIEIPESVTIEADVTDFTMPMAMTMATNDAISTLKLDGESDKIDELKEKSDELSDGMDELTDGTDKLDDGAHKLWDGSGELKDGVFALDDGATDLKDGAHKLFDGTGDLYDGAFKLYDGTATLHDGTVALKDGTSKLNGKTPELADGVNQLKQGTDTLSAGLQTVTSNNEKLTSGASQLAGGLSQLNAKLSDPSAQAQLGALKDGSAQVMAGLNQANGGASQIKDGIEPLKGGAENLSRGISTIADLLEEKNITPDSMQQEIEALNTIYESMPNESPEEKKAKKVVENAMGMLTLYKGFCEKAPALKEGASGIYYGISEQLEPGVNGLAEGINELATNYAQIDAGIGQVVGNMGEIASGVSQLNAGAATLATGVTDYTNGVSQIGDGAKKLKAGTDTLHGKIPELVQGVSDLDDGAHRLESGACTLATGAGDLLDGVGKLKDGARDLADGTDDLKDGTIKLRDGATELSDGVGELVDGTGKLRDGVIKLNDEGISKITDLIGNDIEGYYDRIKAVKDFSKEYTTFSGSCANTEGTVKFIYKTDAVK